MSAWQPIPPQVGSHSGRREVPDRAEVVVWPQRRVDRLVATLKAVDGDRVVRRHSVLEFRQDRIKWCVSIRHWLVDCVARLRWERLMGIPEHRL
eukprot:7387934-Prymnesium_polylepis.1